MGFTAVVHSSSHHPCFMRPLPFDQHRHAAPPPPAGYHVEHHDFPNIPWKRLPALRAIAPEFYAHLASYPSWTGVIWRFLTDPSVGRRGVMTKREARTGGAPAPALTPACSMPLLRGVTAGAIR